MGEILNGNTGARNPRKRGSPKLEGLSDLALLSWPLSLSQEGFGWTNGLALMLLDRYGDQLTSGTQLASLGPHCLVTALLLSLLLQ